MTHQKIPNKSQQKKKIIHTSPSASTGLLSPSANLIASLQNSALPDMGKYSLSNF